MEALSGGDAMVGQLGTIATPAVVAGLNEGKVVASEMGATVTGVNEENLRQYLLELMRAVAGGELAPPKFAVGLRACGIPPGEGTPLLLTDLLWVMWADLPGPECAAGRALLVDLTKDLMKEKLVTKDALMMGMEGAFLEEVGAVPKADTLRRKEVQLNTRMHFTQRRFNLLREESEGFAKLITALCQFAAAAPPSVSAVEALVKEVKALIGFFDLDPNRVLDLTLDAWERAPVCSAFLRLAALFSPDARAQLLGFKFQQLLGQEEGTPPGLCAVAAQLIKAKLVPLERLVPHLGPTDEEAAAAAKEARQQLDTAINKIGMTSLTAGTDKDEGQRSKTGLAASKLQLDARPMQADILGRAMAGSQKVGLAIALLQADDWDHASKLLNVLVSAGVDPLCHAPVAAALCGLIRMRLAPSFAVLYPQGMRGPCILSRKSGGREVEVPQLSEGTVHMLLLARERAAADPALLSQLARLLTHTLLRATVLLASPRTIGEGHRRLHLVRTLTVEVLLPALCLVPANAGLVADVWAILSLHSYTDRWRMYAALRARIAASPVLVAAGKLAATEARKVLRRLHAVDSNADKRERKRATAPPARLMAKIGHANPLAVFQTIVGQIESYGNMVEPVLDSLRYQTAYAFDVLTYLIVDRLASSGRDKLKPDGLNISDWLQALSAFTGQACRKYERMDTAAIAQYLANTLKAAQSYDLLVLKSLVADMTGLVLVEDLSAEQVEALAGGPVLQAEVLAAGGPTPAQQASPKALARTTQRLVAALQHDKLALALLGMLAQQRRYIAAATDSRHLKLIAELYDKCQETLYQYAEFLSTALAPAEYAALLPPVAQLVNNYGIDAEVVFQAYRPLMSQLMPPEPPKAAQQDQPALANGVATPMEEDGEAEEGELEEEEAPKGEGGNDVAMTDAAPEPDTPATTPLPNGIPTRGELVTAPAGPGPGSSGSAGGGGLVWHDFVEDVRATLPADVWAVMSPEFYVTFWSLSYGDVFVPLERYEREIRRLKDMLAMKENEARSKQMLAEQAREMEQRGGMGGGGYGGYGRGGQQEGPSAAELEEEVAAIQRSIVRIKDALKRLPEELRAQQENGRRVDALLQRSRAVWACDRKSMLNAYLQRCVLPRVTYSPADAAYCAAFTRRLHEMALPFFPTILYFDTMMKQLINLVFCCTDREALNLSIFFSETFALLERWRGNEGVYARECASQPGFSTSFKDPAANRTSFGDYRRLCAKWQHTTVSSFRLALGSKNYVQTRNALFILSHIVKVFPATAAGAGRLKAAVTALHESCAFDDLKTMALGYSNKLELEARKPGRMLSRIEYEGLSPGDKPPVAALANGKPPISVKADDGDAAKIGAGARADGKAGGAVKGTPQENGAAAPREKGTQLDGATPEARKASSSSGSQKAELRADAPEFRPGSAGKGNATGAKAEGASTRATAENGGTKREAAPSKAKEEAPGSGHKRAEEQQPASQRPVKRARTSDGAEADADGKGGAAAEKPRTRMFPPVREKPPAGAKPSAAATAAAELPRQASGTPKEAGRERASLRAAGKDAPAGAAAVPKEAATTRGGSRSDRREVAPLGSSVKRGRSEAAAEGTPARDEPRRHRAAALAAEERRGVKAAESPEPGEVQKQEDRGRRESDRGSGEAKKGGSSREGRRAEGAKEPREAAEKPNRRREDRAAAAAAEKEEAVAPLSRREERTAAKEAAAAAAAAAAAGEKRESGSGRKEAAGKPDRGGTEAAAADAAPAMRPRHQDRPPPKEAPAQAPSAELAAPAAAAAAQDRLEGKPSASRTILLTGSSARELPGAAQKKGAADAPALGSRRAAAAGRDEAAPGTPTAAAAERNAPRRTTSDREPATAKAPAEPAVPEGRSPVRPRTVISWVQREAQVAAQDAQKGAGGGGRSRLGSSREAHAPAGAAAAAPASAPASKDKDAPEEGGGADAEDGAGSERAEKKAGKKEKKHKKQKSSKDKKKHRDRGEDAAAGAAPGGEDDVASVEGSVRKEAKKEKKEKRHKKVREV